MAYEDIDKDVREAIFRAQSAVGAPLAMIVRLLVHKGVITDAELEKLLQNSSRPNFDSHTEALYQQMVSIILAKPGS